MCIYIHIYTYIHIYIYIYIHLNTCVYIYIYVYAQTLIVVALIVVKIFSFLNITLLHDLGLGRNLVQMILTGLPELFEHHISYKNGRGGEKTIFKNFQKIEKN